MGKVLSLHWYSVRPLPTNYKAEYDNYKRFKCAKNIVLFWLQFEGQTIWIVLHTGFLNLKRAFLSLSISCSLNSRNILLHLSYGTAKWALIWMRFLDSYFLSNYCYVSEQSSIRQRYCGAFWSLFTFPYHKSSQWTREFKSHSTKTKIKVIYTS